MEIGDLQEHLALMESSDRYRIDQILKESDRESTQLVYLIGADGSNTGPFVRKAFPVDAG